MLIGNKSDSPERVITMDEAQEKADKINIRYMESSCKNNKNIDFIFIGAVKQLLETLPSIKEEDYFDMGVKVIKRGIDTEDENNPVDSKETCCIII